MGVTPDFLAGVIEGFYGPPWSPAERCELFAWMQRWRLNTYLYAPKDDLKHRVLWREPYDPSEARTLAEAVRECDEKAIRFIFAISPGLDINYSNYTDTDLLRKRFEQMIGLGCRNFALLFDDIPDRLQDKDRKRWPSFASAQCDVANALFLWIRKQYPEARFLFCPTPYCGRMAEKRLGGADYLETVGSALRAEIDVLWTGPEIISREISVEHIRQVQRALGRKPVIWDNLHANDYDGRRFYCGPYAGRPPELRGEVSGLLVNPNNEFPLNHVVLRTLADFVHSKGTWDARQAYLSAMSDWLSSFETVTQPVELKDLILFGDCFYLPYEEGPAAEALYQAVRRLMLQDPTDWGDALALFRNESARLRAFCARLTELRDRRLFHALSRRVWDLREALDLLDGYIEFKSRRGGGAYRSDFHLPGTSRGGMLARLERLLRQKPDGSWTSGFADCE